MLNHTTKQEGTMVATLAQHETAKVLAAGRPTDMRLVEETGNLVIYVDMRTHFDRWTITRSGDHYWIGRVH